MHLMYIYWGLKSWGGHSSIQYHHLLSIWYTKTSLGLKFFFSARLLLLFTLEDGFLSTLLIGLTLCDDEEICFLVCSLTGGGLSKHFNKF